MTNGSKNHVYMITDELLLKLFYFVAERFEIGAGAECPNMMITQSVTIHPGKETTATCTFVVA